MTSIFLIMEENLIFLKMEVDLNFILQMEGDLDFILQMEDDLKFVLLRMKDDLNFFKMEDNLRKIDVTITLIFGKRRPLFFFFKWKRTSNFLYGRQTQRQ